MKKIEKKSKERVRKVVKIVGKEGNKMRENGKMFIEIMNES